MKVGIYNAPGGNGVGGSELCAVVLAEALSHEHEVEIVHHKPHLDAAALSAMFGVDLGGSNLRYVPAVWRPYPSSNNPLSRYRDAKAWQAELSASYDLFFAFTHDIPPFCHAPIGIFVVLFASHEREDNLAFKNDSSVIAKYLKRIYHLVEWRGRMKSYRKRLAISEFTRQWTRRRWTIDCEILHPPAGAAVKRTTSKQLMILSVGRFTTHGHSKKQREMMDVFAAMAREGVGAWTYVCAGGLTALDDDRAYFNDVVRVARASGARAEANLERDSLDRLFSEASIFWHASGYGIDESTHPELVEHYGISTVEAMAAGCVPVVINRGGQREIVEHGVSGFLWDSLEQLGEFTRRLMDDDALRRAMSEAAKARAATFSREAFVQKALALITSAVSSAEHP